MPIKIKASAQRHLPEDLLLDILSRLPVNSLLRFRGVSKSWRALLDDDHEFARLHLNTFEKNRNQTRILVVEDETDCVVRCGDTFNPVTKIPSSLPLNWQFVFSADGLFLIRHFNRDNALKLWNPSLRHFRDVAPLPPIALKFESDIGFGYDPLAKDYKLVKLIYTDERGTVVLSVAIYTVGDGSWKIITIEKKSCTWRWYSGLTDSVYLQGSLYFIVTDPQNDKVWHLVSFDLSNEVFSSDPMYDTRFRSWKFDRKKKLSLIDGRFYLPVYDIYCFCQQSVWVLERETMNWTEYYSYNIEVGRPLYALYVKKNGDLLTWKETSSFSDETKEQTVASYNPQTHEYKLLQKTSFPRGRNRICDVSDYVESLFLHQCNTSS